jgi:hypothetical protein
MWLYGLDSTGSDSIYAVLLRIAINFRVLQSDYQLLKKYCCVVVVSYLVPEDESRHGLFNKRSKQGVSHSNFPRFNVGEFQVFWTSL